MNIKWLNRRNLTNLSFAAVILYLLFHVLCLRYEVHKLKQYQNYTRDVHKDVTSTVVKLTDIEKIQHSEYSQIQKDIVKLNAEVVGLLSTDAALLTKSIQICDSLNYLNDKIDKHINKNKKEDW